jgi:hypothetical protein
METRENTENLLLKKVFLSYDRLSSQEKTDNYHEGNPLEVEVVLSKGQSMLLVLDGYHSIDKAVISKDFELSTYSEYAKTLKTAHKMWWEVEFYESQKEEIFKSGGYILTPLKSASLVRIPILFNYVGGWGHVTSKQMVLIVTVLPE